MEVENDTNLQRKQVLGPQPICNFHDTRIFTKMMAFHIGGRMFLVAAKRQA